MRNSLLGRSLERMEVMFYLVLEDNLLSSRRGGEGRTEEEQEQNLRGWSVGQRMGQESVQVDTPGSSAKTCLLSGKNKRALNHVMQNPITIALVSKISW